MRKLPTAWRSAQRAEVCNRKQSDRLRSLVRRKKVVLAPHDSARVAGLRYVNDVRTPGIRRIGRHNRFRYVDPSGRTISNPAERERIRSLVIPPAWTDVWICADPRGHLQATGRDARGRKQYRYHPRWREVRDEVKYGRLITFAQALPRIRGRVASHLRRQNLPREKVLAAVVQLLEKTLIRVGNEEYARDNKSFGLTTMRDKHARVNGSAVRFEFRGKHGIQHAIDLRDRRLARIIKSCRELPGYELFKYVDNDGRHQVIDSADVNAYLREISGQDFTAKDFRTWAGTVAAALALQEFEPFESEAEGKRNVVEAIESVANRLRNTPTVCRTCYIHPELIASYLEGSMRDDPSGRGIRGLEPEEAFVLRLLERRARR
jgi:DNA topoisomerase-1